MKYFKYTIIPLLVILISGCIDDDNKDCEPTVEQTPVNLRFSYVGDSTTQIFDQKIQKVNLFVFNSEKRNILVKTIDKSDLLKLRGVELNIPSGDYYVVCVGNAFGDTKVDSDLNSVMDSMRVSHPNVINKTDVTTNDSLYYGIKKITVSSSNSKKYKTQQAVQDTVKFVSAHIKMHIEVAGLLLDNIINSTTKSTTATQYPSLVVENLVASINLANITSKELYSYYPIIKHNIEQNIYYTDFNILRIQPQSSVVLNLKDPAGKSLYSMKLSDFLAKYAQFNLTKNELTIGIKIQMTAQGVSVTVPQWVINEGGNAVMQ